MSHLFVPSLPSSVPTSQLQRGLFAASTTHVPHLAEMFNALAAIDRYALITIGADGISVFTEHNHILNALANFEATLFSTYKFDFSSQSSVLLGVDILLLSELFAAAASTVVPKAKSTSGGPAQQPLVESVVCYLKYEDEGSPLIVEFEDQLIVERLEFSTFNLDLENPYSREAELEDLGGLIVNSAMLQFAVIIKSDIFHNLLQDIQVLDTEELYMFVSNVDDEDLLNFVSKSVLGYSKLIYPNAKSSLQKLEVYSESMEQIASSVVSVLNFQVFVKILRAVKQSVKCKLIKDSEGVISVQLLCKNVNCAGYPGTMVTFNMLEKTTMPTEATAAEIARAFDEGACEYIKEYTVLTGGAAPKPQLAIADVPNPSAPGLSYASFKKGDDQATETKRNEVQPNSETNSGSGGSLFQLFF